MTAPPSTQTFTPIAPRPAPNAVVGPVAWVRANLLHDWRTTLSTIIVGGILAWYLPQLISWGVFRAAWAPDVNACRADGAGACWGVIAEKFMPAQQSGPAMKPEIGHSHPANTGVQ